MSTEFGLSPDNGVQRGSGARCQKEHWIKDGDVRKQKCHAYKL